MTIKEARKILGKLANNLSDEQLKNEIEVVDFLSELFFAQTDKESPIWERHNDQRQ